MDIQKNNPEMKENRQINRNLKFNMSDCFAVILAGGDGLDNQMFVPKLMRGQRPPQFLRRAGEDFLINQTRDRIASAFPSDKIFLTVTETHSRYYKDILADLPPRNLIVQPQNDGTVFEILYAAMRLAKVDPRAVLAFFPMDFSIRDDETFFAQVKSACVAVSRKPQLILLGLEPESYQLKSEWIEIDQSKSLDPGFKLWRILNFWHKQAVLPEDRSESGKFFINSSVMVGTASTFLRKIKRAAPEIYGEFAAVRSKIGTNEEEKAIRNIYYANFAETNFTKEVLEKSADKLAMIPVSPATRAKTQKL